MRLHFIYHLMTLGLLALACAAGRSQTTVMGIVPLATFGGEVFVNTTSWQQITRTTYTAMPNLFSAIPVTPGATRKYYLVLRRADNQPGGNGSYWRFSCSGPWNNGTWVPGHGFTLGSNWGNQDEGTTDWIEVPPGAVSSSCTTAYWEVDAEMANTATGMRVMSVSLAAVDVVNGTNIGYNQAASGADALPPLSWGYDYIWATGPGNVGIGTSTPAQRLEVNGNAQIDGFLQLGTGGVQITSGGIVFPNGGGTQSAAWTGVICGGDFAESVNVDGDRTWYEPGDVLVVDPHHPGEVARSGEPYSSAVVGVYSTRPGVVGRRQKAAKSPDEVPMAMVGIVPIKVSAENGAIRPGDLLVSSSIPGYAMKGTDRSRMLGAVIGKSFGRLDNGTGVIEVGVSLQ